MAGKQYMGSDTAQKANAKAAKESKNNPAQVERRTGGTREEGNQEELLGD